MKTCTHKSVVVKEFSRFAHSYDGYNIIQKKVAEELIAQLPLKKYDKIIDIGCGSGVIYNCLTHTGVIFNTFIALDSSDNMLTIHPTSDKIEKYCIDFDDSNAFNNLGINNQNLLLSSSALQWSQDLETLMIKLSILSKQVHFSIFTSNTFKTLHQTANIESPIYPIQTLKNIIRKHYDAHFEIRTYKLYFDDTREMLKYIKKSGVSGGEKQLGYTQTKELMTKYPLDYLEFEVLFVSTVSLAKSK